MKITNWASDGIVTRSSSIIAQFWIVVGSASTMSQVTGTTNQELTEGLELLWGNVVKKFWQRLAVTWVFVALLPGPNTGRQQDLLEAESSKEAQEPTSASQNSGPVINDAADTE